MASNSGWDKTIPSGTSLISGGDDDLRSFKSFMQAWWEEEHYATDGSASSAGEHKLGSARAYVGTSSQLSNPVEGRVFFNKTDGALWGATSNSSWSRIASNVQLDSEQTWTELQEFTSGVSSSALTVTGEVAIGGALNVTSGFTVLAADIGANADAVTLITLVNESPTISKGDPIFVGFTRPSDADSWFAQGLIRSNDSIGIRFLNKTVSRRTLPSGTTVRYAAFLF